MLLANALNEIDESGPAEDRERLALQVSVVLDVHADVGGGVVHVVLDGVAVDDLRLEHVLFHEFEVGAEAQPPTPDSSRQVLVRWIAVVPLDASQDARAFDVAEVPAVARLRGEIR